MSIKRLFDFFLAFSGLLVFGSVILICIILASIDTKSFGLFFQERIGQYGKPFTIFKIKTVNDTSKSTTRFGRFLRISKLDELPQLINVLIGNMSLVGPRPDISGYYDQLQGENRKILELKPGITSLASLKYNKEEELLAMQKEPLKYNNEVLFPDKVRMNLEYYYKNSIFGDIKIIIKTIIK